MKGLKYSSDKNYHLDHNVIGTKYYIAPEVLKQLEYMSEEIDIFSLGVTVFIMIYGKPPFLSASKNDKSYKLIIEKNFEEFWKLVESKNAKNISTELKDLIFSMLSYDALDRPTAKLILENLLFQSIENKISPALLKMQYRSSLDEKKANTTNSSSSSPSNNSALINSFDFKNPFSTELEIPLGVVSPLR